MHSATFLVFVVLAIPYAAIAIPTAIQFNAYCQQVARAAGRSAENQGGFWSTDEDGNTPFQREQLRKLRTGEYKELANPLLVTKGEALARKLTLTRWLTLGWVLSVVATELWLY